ncbi:MAG TPA: iron ABC transporter permease [Burkholderiaceae bacterium]|nr:iron ABC transporter permease [Burkholderiaceae bacterium]
MRPLSLRLPFFPALRYSRDQHGPALLLAPAALLLLLFVLPLLYVYLRAREAGWDASLRLLLRPRVAELLGNTIALDLVVTLASIAIGVTTAWCIERTNLPGRKAWNVLVTLPFAVPAFVSGYSWISVFPRIEGFFGAALVLTFSYYPLVHLPVAAAFRNMDPALEETSRSLGYGGLHTFFRVTLPHLRPALAGGAVLVALHMLAEFGALAFLNYDTLTVAIFDQYEVAFNSAMAAILTAVLLLLCLIVLLFEYRARGGFTYEHSRKSVSGTLKKIDLGVATPWVLVFFTLLVAAAIGVPMGSLSYWIATGSSAGFDMAEIGRALYATVSFGFGGATVATLFALPLVILSVRYRGFFATLSDRLPYFIHSLPGLVIGLTFVFFSVRYINPLYQTVALLILGYAMLYLPLAQSSIRGVLVLIPRQMEDVARSLGKSSPVIFMKIILPLLWSGVGAGFALVFMKVMTELTATLILRPTGVDTLATKVWEHTNEVQYAASAPYAILLILISGLPVYLLTMRQAGRTKG